ncbi:hypothetical protein D1007_26601 [Hordeum vulgare]|nr:hypothetical protein D1007_26601 [Hordeum vulgare]
MTLFFQVVVNTLKLLQASEEARLANESRRLCRGALLKVLTILVHDLTLERLPKEADLKELEKLVMPIVDKVDRIKRVQGPCRD